MNCVINFLSEKGSTVKNLNSLRNDISAYHVQIKGNYVGRYPKVCALLAGIFDPQPPQLK